MTLISAHGGGAALLARTLSVMTTGELLRHCRQMYVLSNNIQLLLMLHWGGPESVCPVSRWRIGACCLPLDTKLGQSLKCIPWSAAVLRRDAEERGEAFNARPYFRLCVGLISEVSGGCIQFGVINNCYCYYCHRQGTPRTRWLHAQAICVNGADNTAGACFRRNCKC